MPNWTTLGAGIWMIGTGIDGIKTLSGALKFAGGVILVIASFIAG